MAIFFSIFLPLSGPCRGAPGAGKIGSGGGAVKLRKLARSIQDMPRGAYILLKAVLMLCCALLGASLALFIVCLVLHPEGSGLRMTAVTLLETPAGLLIAGGIGVAFLIDRS